MSSANRLKIISITAVCFILFTAGCFETKSTDKKTSEQLTKSIFFKYGDVGLKNVSKEGLVSIIDREVKKGTDSVAVKEAYYDKSRFSISLIAKRKDMIANEFEYKFYYDGKLLQDSSRWVNISKIVQDRQYDIVSFDTKPDFPSILNIKIVATRLGNSKEAINLEVPVDRTAADVITKEKSIMKTFSFKSRNVYLRDVLFTPSSTIIKYEYKGVSYDTLSTPVLFDQNSKKVVAIGKDGLTQLGSGNNKIVYEHSGIYGPLSLDPGQINMSFVFIDDDKNKIPVAVQFNIP